MTEPRSTTERLRRWLLAAVGVVAVAIGGIGVFVPGLPTTIFLLLASVCFTKSCPVLEERLVRNRFFAPYLRYLDGDTPMPRRTRLSVIGVMWISVTVSVVLLLRSGAAEPWVGAVIIGAGAIGTVAIMRWPDVLPRRRAGV